MHQDNSCQNLRGRSFKGQNLEGANFSYADIRSTNFSGANLRNANFSHATAGLQKRWAIFLVCISCVLSGISGFFLASTEVLTALVFDSSSLENQIAGWTALIVVIVLFIVILRQGLNSAFTVAFTVAFAVAVVVAFAFAFDGAFAVVFVAVAFAFAKEIFAPGEFADFIKPND
ncbi:pentapeptide repeat-containing protein [Nostoc sp. 'Peltigera membranacea cyanobiont' 232]|uniref:pentapeptide repeat-containing protein n=1 Tax=Nostoc sp. 'Peltigera membranacea cyanobiont' 232 TaxID=2014531 RepID=UPI000B950550|nr:pentapeptide repeat-containing protein [Nostoc sp. 'Peltigera membranacea cyanobiont' 232]OYE01711.1 hypothetical protein CDG79_27940 [Nostoc sp. 'Peltigera membranacea cyanobiont' 232]